MTEGEKPDVRPQDAAASLKGRQGEVDKGGRPKGSRDKRPSKARRVARAAREVKRIADMLGVDFFTGSALVLLQCVYKDPRQPGAIRLQAASLALPYESPRLSAVEHSGAIGTLTHEEALKQLSEKPTVRPALPPPPADGADPATKH